MLVKGKFGDWFCSLDQRGRKVSQGILINGEEEHRVTGSFSEVKKQV